MNPMMMQQMHGQMMGMGGQMPGQMMGMGGQVPGLPPNPEMMQSTGTSTPGGGPSGSADAGGATPADAGGAPADAPTDTTPGPAPEPGSLEDQRLQVRLALMRDERNLLEQEAALSRKIAEDKMIAQNGDAPAQEEGDAAAATSDAPGVAASTNEEVPAGVSNDASASTTANNVEI